MLKLFLWLKFLRRKKIVLLSITAVALSCALLIIVSSLFNGFISAFERSAVQITGDIVIAPPTELAKFTKYELLIGRLEQIRGVRAATAMLSAPGLLRVGKGDVRAVQIWGIEPERRAKVTGFKQDLVKQSKLPGEPSFQVPGSPERNGVFVGVGVVAEPDEKTDQYDFDAVEKMIGRDVLLTTGAVIEEFPNAEEMHSGSQVNVPSSSGIGERFKRKSVKLTITDIVFTGVYEIDRKFVYLPIKELQKNLYPNEDEPIAHEIQIKLTGDAQTDVVLAQIRGIWEYFAAKQLGWQSYLIRETEITTSKQMQSRQIAEFRKQMRILQLIFGIVSCSAVLLVGCIFYMIVITKQKDIAVVKSCGATTSSVALIFIGFGACVGIIGSVCGAILGYIVTKNINTIEQWISIIFGLKLWKSSVYIFSKIPNEIDWSSALPIALSAVAAATVGALIPAVIAIRTKPVDILRYE
jgi:lipoprotein-releasing system permease protein